MKKHLFFILLSWLLSVVEVSLFTLPSSSFSQGTLLLKETFESGALPSGWTRSQAVGADGWEFGDDIQLSSNYFSIPAHGKFAASNDDDCNCNSSADMLMSPAMNFTGQTTIYLEFETYFRAWSYSEGWVKASTNGSTWTDVQVIYTASSWQKHRIDLSAYAGQPTVYIAFSHDDNGYWASGIGIDNVRVIAPQFTETVVYAQNFDNCTQPTGWTRSQGPQSVGFEFGNSTYLSSNGFYIPAHGCYAAASDAKYDNGTGTLNYANVDMLIAPKFNLTGYTSLFIKADIRRDTWSYGTLERSSDSLSWLWMNFYADDADWLYPVQNISFLGGNSSVYLRYHADDSNLNFPGDGLGVDNFKIYVPLSRDIGVTMVSPVQYVQVGNNTVTGQIKNFGGDTITSLNIGYRINGGTAQNHAVTSINYGPLNWWNFTHNIPLNIPTPGTYTLEVWTNSPNGQGDMYPWNDTITQTLIALPYMPQQTVIMEEYTGTWCCPCADGIDIMDTLLPNHPDIVAIGIHDGGLDPMTIPEGTTLRQTFTNAYPTASFDRIKLDDQYNVGMSRGYWGTHYPWARDQYEPVEVTIPQLSYDTVTRNLTLDVSAKFYEDYSGDLRFSVSIVEDSVYKPGDPDYVQSCASGDPYLHRHVLRAMPDGAFGLQGNIPTTVTSGSSYTKTFTYTIPPDFDENLIHIVAYVHRYNYDRFKRKILNGIDTKIFDWTAPAAIEEPTSIASATFFPDPFTENLSLMITLTESENVSVEFFDLNGKWVGNIPAEDFGTGTHIMNWANGNSLPQGVYLAKISAGDHILTQRVVKIH